MTPLEFYQTGGQEEKRAKFEASYLFVPRIYSIIYLNQMDSLHRLNVFLQYGYKSLLFLNFYVLKVSK